MMAYTQHRKLTELVKSERKITEAILKAILEIDISKAYLELGYSSLFDYLTKAQKYSESAAQRRISAARLIKELPEIKPQIQDGTINLTQLAKLAIAIKQEERRTGKRVQQSQKQQVIAKMNNKTSFETERLLSEELNYSNMQSEKVSPQAESIMLTIKLSKSQYEKLERVKNYLSHSEHDAGFAKIIETLCDKLIQKKEGRKKQNPKTSAQDPKTSAQETEKAEPASASTAAAAVNPSVPPKKNPAKTQRSPIPVHIQREIFKRANYCCEYKSKITGIRCNNPYQLQVDHQVPLAKGGSNNPENLRALCRAHNLSEAKRWGLPPRIRH